jgi:hypothetical protein
MRFIHVHVSCCVFLIFNRFPYITRKGYIIRNTSTPAYTNNDKRMLPALRISLCYSECFSLRCISCITFLGKVNSFTYYNMSGSDWYTYTIYVYRVCSHCVRLVFTLTCYDLSPERYEQIQPFSVRSNRLMSHIIRKCCLMYNP